MNNTTKKTLIFCALATLLTTGCGEPNFSQMKSSQPKWAMAVVANPSSNTEKSVVENIADELAAQKDMAAMVDWTTPDQEADAIQKWTTKQGIDLILLDHATPNLNELAQKDTQVRFAVFGDASTPTELNVRHLTLNRAHLMFLAGFLAAEANKQSNQPFSVLVEHPLAADDPDWQMILAGNHYAGRHDVPVQVMSTAATIDQGQDTQPNQAKPSQQTDTQLVKQSPPKTKLSGKSMVLLTDVTDSLLPQVRSLGMKLIQTDQSGQTSRLQANVVAEPMTDLQSAMSEEAQLLASGQWQGEQTVTLPDPKIYKLLDPKVFSDKQTGTLLEILEEQLSSGALKPDDYVLDRTTGR